MTGLLTIIPVISTQYADRCLESILMDNSAAEIRREDILVVDNTREGLPDPYHGVRTYRDPDGHNLGVARSWNVGAREVMERGLDYLILMSASMLFGPIKETTWTRQMQTFWGADVIEADGHSWHLVALHRRCFERVGYFDENFYPAYFEQIDWCRRLRMLDMEGGWPRVWVNALSQGVALHAPLIDCPAKPLLDYYRAKWGGDKGAETYTVPFGDKSLDYFPERSVPELVREYGLAVWW